MQFISMQMAYRILHVLSSNFFAGSTAYAICLSEKQASDGNEVYFATDRNCVSDMISYVYLPVSNRSWISRFRNVLFLKKFIKNHHIDVVHAHSRAASWICYYSLRRTQVALVSTIHGRQAIHSTSRKSNIFGERIIGICPNLITHLKDELMLDSKKLEFIPNGFNMDFFQHYHRTRQDDTILFSFIGRFNGPKGDKIVRLMLEVFPALLEEYPNLIIKLYGGEWDSLSLIGKGAYNELKIVYGARIEQMGFVNNIHQVFVDSELVIGAGRVALESLMFGVPVLAIGEACSHGIISSSNIKEAILTNFGDILSVDTNFEVDTHSILEELRNFLKNQKEYKVNLSHYLEMYDIQNVYTRIMKIYRSVLMRKAYHGNIPVLMYHKIPDAPIQSKHRIFVERKKFEKHLQFFKFRGMTSITFKDYLSFANGERPIREFPKKPFILTFDDGYEDNYRNMLPLVKKFGFKGVLFLLGDFSVLSNYWDIEDDPDVNRLMTIEQKKEFVSLGWEIGAHTISHCNLTLLSGNSALKEIEMSKSCLEEKLQTNVISFAYPFGASNEEVKGLVEKSGFEFGILTDNGGIYIEDDRYAVFRVSMFPEENLFQLFKKTSSWYRTYYRRRRGH